MLRSCWVKLFAAGALPVAVCAAWIPLRGQLPTADLALVLVVVIGSLGWVAGARAALVSAVTAAVGFDFLDARPYGTLAMSRGIDITTALLLLVTGSLVGSGAAGLARYHRSTDRRTDALAVVMEASGLVATGEEQHLVTEALGTELLHAFGLAACEFRDRPPTGVRPIVARDGGLVGLVDRANRAAPQIDLPVWCQGEVVAHYRLTPGSKTPSRDELRVALSLADQAGAALANTGHRPPPGPKPSGRIRLLRSRTTPENAEAGAGETENRRRPSNRGTLTESKASILGG